MASFLIRLSQAVDAIRGIVAKPQSPHDPLRILEDTDRYRNLHSSLAIVSFFLSAGIGVVAFFLSTDAMLWAGIDKPVAMLLVAISWILIFPIWVLAFLSLLSLLGLMGVKDVRSLVRSRLSNPALSRAQLLDLQNALASRTWRHGPIFKTVLADLTKEPLEC